MKSYNNVSMKGRLFNYSLQHIETEKGEAISGEVTLEVDEQGTTVSFRMFGYPVYSSGKPNRTYHVLDDMLAGNYKTVADDGDEADWLGITGSIDVSYFVGKNGDEELARSQKIRGAFINQNKDKKYENKWKADLLITNIREVEADEEKKLPAYVTVSGYLIDDYREMASEATFQARTEAAMNYISSLEASETMPYYVSIWGGMQKVSRSVVRKNAFGEDEVDEFTSTQWVVTGMSPECYVFGDDITTEQYGAIREKLKEHKQEQKDKHKEKEGEVELAF